MPVKALIRALRERVNVRIYSSKQRVINLLRGLRFLVSFGMIGLLVYVHGFPNSSLSFETYQWWISGSFLFFIVSFLIRLFFDFEPRSFLRGNWLEGSLLLVVTADLVSRIVFQKPLIAHFMANLPAEAASQVFFVFSQLVLLLIVLLELGKFSQRLSVLRLNPSLLFVGSFLLLIGIGTGLLMLPAMTQAQVSMPFLDALFTSVSASCVTGLIVVDTATYFSLKGQWVILVLIQLGGLNIISFASFFGTFLRRGMGIRQQRMIKDFMSYDSLNSTRSLLKRVIVFTLMFESLGAAYIFMTWDPSVPFAHAGERLFHSVFHSISAFNNAGFSTFSGGLFEPGVRNSYIMHLGIAALVFFGGIGITVLNDLFDPVRMRRRLREPWRRLEPGSRLALYTGLVLLLAGALVFGLVEARNPAQLVEGGFRQQNWFEQSITAVFQSMITRTAGFNTTDIGILATPTLLFFIFLMFIGAGSGGTGGGVKTSTFSVIFLSALSTIRGKRLVEIYRHTISSELLNKAFSIFLFSVSVIFAGLFVLTFTEPDVPFLHLLFEEVSAFATVGLSTGITSDLSEAGRLVLMVSMFLGRVGVLTLAVAVSRKAITNNYKYPDAYLMLG